MNQPENYGHYEVWAELFVERLIKVVIIVAIVIVCSKLIHLACKRILEMGRRENQDGVKHAIEREKRLATVVKLLDTTFRIILFSAAFLMILRELGLDITPFLTGAGIAGVALGFGAQSLVKDVISGFFLLLEDQIRVGDVIKVNNLLSGTVEHMQLRVSTLRDSDGTLHTIPNGQITSVSNMTHDFGQAVVDIPVRYQTDVRKLIETLERVSREFDLDSNWKASLLAPTKVVGIVDFKPAYMVAEIVAKTEPHSRWAVATELRKRAKQSLEEQNDALMPGVLFPQQ